jgi:hypothetical protein
MPEIRNATTNETPTETTDRMAGGGKPHPSAAGPTPFSKAPPPNIKPVTPGNYGAPVDKPIFGSNS